MTTSSTTHAFLGKPAAQTSARSVAHAALFVLLSISFWIAAGAIATISPYWMDEVLAVWTARQPTVSAVWGALNKGAEFSPPLYHLLLQKIIQLGGGSPISLRLPSIAAVYVIAIVAFILTRRRHPVPFALLAMAMCLASCLFLFAIQARQNALVAASFSLCLLLWDIPADKRPSWLSAIAMCALLAIAIGMHFYAVLLAAALGLMELVWMASHRRIRWPHVLAIGIAGMSIVLWLPIIQSVSAFNAGDTSASEYYARPLFSTLVTVYPFLLVGHNAVVLSPLTVLVIAIVIRAVLRWPATDATPLQRPIDNLNIIVWVTCAIPILVFTFACLVTHTFNMRYVIAATLGLSILAAQLLVGLRWAVAGCYLATVLAIGLLFHATTLASQTPPITRALSLIEQSPLGLPIVTGNGLRYLELSEATKPALAGRLVYLKSPAGTISPDPTNEHQVERWASIDPHLAVTEIASFVSKNPKFLLFSDGGAVDLLPSQLAVYGYTINEIARNGTAYVAEVQVARK